MKTSTSVRVLPDADGVRVVVCVGEFDADTVRPLDVAAHEALDDPAVRRLVLDVSTVTFADSSVLYVLLRTCRSGRLVLAGPVPSRLERLFDMTGVASLFTVVDGVEAARSL
ncbi:STAS domain-containing protein [Streptomyces sp. NPDC058623]|uniref:STAS domain-containing protein n=1 Tax=Streptomyces sp. NPDC058623 TaxID=3346563 RepID=UPI00365CA114